MVWQTPFQNWLFVWMLWSFPHFLIGIWSGLLFENISLYNFECFCWQCILMDCFNWRNHFLSMLYLSINLKCYKVMLIKDVIEICDAFFLPFNSDRDDLFAVKSVLFHMGIWVVGENIVFFILLIFLQAVRVAAIMDF